MVPRPVVPASNTCLKKRLSNWHHYFHSLLFPSDLYHCFTIPPIIDYLFGNLTKMCGLISVVVNLCKMKLLSSALKLIILVCLIDKILSIKLKIMIRCYTLSISVENLSFNPLWCYTLSISVENLSFNPPLPQKKESSYEGDKSRSNSELFHYIKTLSIIYPAHSLGLFLLGNLYTALV